MGTDSSQMSSHEAIHSSVSTRNGYLEIDLGNMMGKATF